MTRARRHSRKPELGEKAIGLVTMCRLLQGYLSRVPGSIREEEVAGAEGAVRKVKRCVYTPHSLRATTATLLLEAGVDIIKEKDLLGSPARDDEADLRQAAAEQEGGGVARCADLSPLPPVRALSFRCVTHTRAGCAPPLAMICLTSGLEVTVVPRPSFDQAGHR